MNIASMSRPCGIALTVALLVVSNILMLLAWYGHLKAARPGGFAESMPLFLVILASWGIAFFEYCVMIPANRIGASVGLGVAQLKIIQEVITVAVFIPFVVLFMGERWRWDYLWALLCMVGAVYFVNRARL